MSKAVLQFFLSPEARAAGVKFQAPRELDAGFDIPSLEAVKIEAGGFALLKTGVHLAIPEGWVGLVRDRSSVALKGGVTSAGVIDASYRGELKIAFHNLGKQAIEFQVGDRIAQILILPHLSGSQSMAVEELSELGNTLRGAGGFGSTGN